MNLRDLHYLIVLAETKHFGKAAEKCFVSQPTLSMQLKKLENELGALLIHRHLKDVQLTPVGKLIVEKAHQIEALVTEMKGVARSALDPLSADLHLAVIPTVAPYLLPLILPEIKQKLPNMTLFLHEEKTESSLRLLEQGKVDAAILALPVEGKNQVVLPLYQEDFLLAMPALHPLSRFDEVSVDEIPLDELLLLTEGHCLRDQALQACGLLKEKSEFAATSLETLRCMVAAGNGVTLLPALAVNPALAGVVTRPLKPAPGREIGLVYPRSSHLLACLTVLAEVCQKIHKK